MDRTGTLAAEYAIASNPQRSARQGNGMAWHGMASGRRIASSKPDSPSQQVSSLFATSHPQRSAATAEPSKQIAVAHRAPPCTMSSPLRGIIHRLDTDDRIIHQSFLSTDCPASQSTARARAIPNLRAGAAAPQNCPVPGVGPLLEAR
ncbi:hypothetical protein CCHR01_14210 [Colletotrichum chrysophilum]|uniref:Uncharacterized protein n=1 Tax=Colletotrichum chrysophilum TaxID=1836956 RepID=A0AAD9A813_9PEZI|nr:hypothetical protein CCHR01_14210 [Colletotrichum chrysophilum]